MGTTKIPYCDKTLDVSLGCRKRSPGCGNCWALPVVNRMIHNPALRGLQKSIVRNEDGHPAWFCGDVGYQWFPKALDKLRMQRPAFWFINSKSDLFDERADFVNIAKLFDRMAATAWHRYSIFTKEVGRLAQFLGAYENEGRFEWPRDFPHVILMTSIEDAGHLDRWGQLREIPAALRGISFEPVIGPVAAHLPHVFATGPKPDWIVIGCEKLSGGWTGRWAREEPLAWWREAENIVGEAYEADIKVWMKQGPVEPVGSVMSPEPVYRKVTSEMRYFPERCRVQQPPPWPANHKS